MVEAILKGAPDVQFLATSREPLRAEGEWLKRLPPLESPAPDDWPMTAAYALPFPAVALFVERAEAILGSFALAESDFPLVADICRKLDGIPLAIELATALVDTLGITELAAQVNDCLSILTQGRRAAQGRHRSLRAALDWSLIDCPSRNRFFSLGWASSGPIFLGTQPSPPPPTQYLVWRELPTD